MTAPSTSPPRAPASQQRRRRGWCFAAAPAVLAVLPLVGMSLKSDERLHLHRQVELTDVNLIRIGQYVEERIWGFLDAGNFRPIGRFFEVLVHGFVFEAAEATGLSPHVLLGVVRLASVALLAVLAYKVVEALARSAGVPMRGSLVGLFPLVMGAVVVANGIIGGLAQFPHTFIGSVALILATALATARDRDLGPRPVRGHEYASMAALGVLLVVFYDVAYLAPPAALGFLAARATAAGLRPRAVLATAAVRRWAALSGGFAAAFIPIRIEIARRCAREACYSASDLSISPDAITTALPRLATGLPPVGWDYNAELAGLFGVEVGLGVFTANAVLLLMLAALVALTVRTVATGWRRNASTDAPDPAVVAEGAIPARLAIALVGLGSVMALLSASLAGLSASMQQRNLPIGAAWRETTLVQVAWAFIAAGVLAALDLAARSERTRQALRAAAAAALAVALAFTLLANWRFAEVDRRDPTAAVTSLIATSTIHLDDSEHGDEIRCALIDAYTELTPPKVWINGERLRVYLDDFMEARHGYPYCSQPPKP